MAKALAVLAGLADWQRAPTLLTPLPLALIAFGLAIQFTPANTIERLDRIYQRLPTIVVGALVGAALLLIEAVGGDGSAPFIYFQF